MNKVLNHLKNNAVIYLIILACIVVALVTLFVNHEGDTKRLDSSQYTPVDIKGIDFLFSDNTAKLLLIGTDTCSATIKYSETLNFEMIKYGYKVYYLNLENVDLDSDAYKNFIKKLDIDYEYNGIKGKFYDFMSNGQVPTPMTVIIKNGKMVYGYIGTMSSQALEIYTELYGVSHGVVN